MKELNENINQTIELIKNSKKTIAFTGAGISVESGIPPFRGEGGIWNKYDPEILELNYFYRYPEKSWEVIKEIFYSFFGKASPNPAHYLLADLEKKGLLSCVITQNIDNLHREAGSMTVHEFHGNSHTLTCIKCKSYYPFKEIDLTIIPPRCKKCDSVLKPDFIFFGEGIPQEAYTASFKAASETDLCIVIGTTGEVMPAGMIPITAKRKGAKIIEMNTNHSTFTDEYTDVFLKGKAGEISQMIMNKLCK